MTQNYAITIITGYDGLDRASAIGRAAGHADIVGVPVTITHGHGYHPDWDAEPVLVITAFHAGSALPYRLLAERLADAFNQDAVLFHVQSSPAPEFVTGDAR